MNDADAVSPMEIAKQVEAQISDRTSRRVHGLKVHPSEGRISISGRVHTFHIKQLALNAAMESLGRRCRLVAHFDIQVMNAEVVGSH